MIEKWKCARVTVWWRWSTLWVAEEHHLELDLAILAMLGTASWLRIRAKLESQLLG